VIALRRVIMVTAIAVAGLVLWRTLRGVDARGVWSAVASLGPFDVLAILALFAALMTAEAFLAAAFVPGLSIGRGAMSFLIPGVATSVAPGPADYPVRYKLLRSWGYDSQAAATASAGPTLFNSAHKMVMPILAAAAFTVGDVHVAGMRRLIVIGAAVFGVTSAVVLVTFGSETRTAAVGTRLERLLRRPIEHHLVAARNRAAQLVRQVWRRVLIGIVLVVACSVALFVVCVRSTGTPSTTAPWLGLLGVWATVRAISALPTTPGDVGISEVAYVSLLTQMSGSAHVNAYAAGVLVYRTLTAIAPIPLGLVAVAIWRRPRAESGAV
jgi:uncharacterized membrane protein YbhN (UPF0104 family)